METIQLNEYIERFKEIQPQLDLVCESLFVQRIHLENDGCAESIVRKCVKYLEDHDIRVSCSNKELLTKEVL